jgi:hypothetical protein
MPKWLINKTLKRLGEIDRQHEAGLITTAEHDRQSKQALESAIATERHIATKYSKKYDRVLGKHYQ